MSIDLTSRCEELAVFADIGTEPPRSMAHGSRHVIGMCRNGEELEFEFEDSGNGRVIERHPDGSVLRTHKSYRALLASENFGHLRRWADQQKKLLKEDPQKSANRIPVQGLLSKTEPQGGSPLMDVEGLDQVLSSTKQRGPGSVHIMLIDGPAGIGKTKFIEFLAQSRAEKFLIEQRPLVLHVQSRGRVLTFLQDLIAFSLQRLRLAVTFDQLPVLVRHGLVTLAIDGFDELGDPNGYDLAWSQVNDLITQVRGEGTLILAGRETFIGPERIEQNIPTLRTDDFVNALSLQPPYPDVARKWLRNQGWHWKDIDSIGPLLEPGSYALRPLFLAQVAKSDIAETIGSRPDNPLALLIEWMIEREAGKFGDPVERIMDDEQRRTFVQRLLQEIACHLADDQTEAIDEVMIAWLAEFVSPENIDQEVLRILKNRAAVLALLENDDRPNYRRFAHSQLYNHFLGSAMIDAILDGEMPKFVRRNILGADFLGTFSDLALHAAESEPQRIQDFFQHVYDRVRTHSTVDRGPRNLGALLITMLPAMEETDDLRIEGLDVDESLIRGTAPAAALVKSAVNQLDVRGADIHSVIFENCMIGTLIVDQTTRVPESCPVPALIRHERPGDGGGDVIREPERVEAWLSRHGRTRPGLQEADTGLVPNDLRDNDLVKLLGRVCRSRSFWIPERKSSEDRIHKFVDNPRWPDVFEVLKRHGFVLEENFSSSGPRNVFFHVKRSKDILSEDPNDPQIRGFYKDLIEKIRTDSRGA